MYKNFIFDLYGTLIDIRTDEWSDEFWDDFAEWMTENEMSYSGKELHRIYDEEIKRLEKKATGYDFPEIDLLPVFKTICLKRKTSITDEEVWEAGENFRKISTKMIRLYPNTLKVLKELKKLGKNVYLLSNAQRVFTWQELESMGIAKYFDDIFISSDAGCKKPDTAFYKKLMDKHNLAVEECIMIGNDSTSDIAGANAVGMDAFYVRTEISPENDPAPDCKYVFDDGDIGHVLELIKK